jgi:peptide subunit release factor 1 (eRF1)
MPYFDREDIEKLSRLKTEPYWVTSVFLTTDKSLQSKKEIALNFKNLLAEGRNRLGSLNLEKNIISSLEADLEKISQHISLQLNSLHHPGLALFSSTGKNIFMTYNLPHPPRNRLVFDPNPYLRPLMAILDRYHRILTLVLSRREAKWYKIFMGEASLVDSLTSDVPGKVREGGWEGYESKRIERHIEAHVHDHLKKVSQKTFDLFKQNKFDWLFLACEDKLLADFEPLLHRYLKERLKGRIKAKITDSVEKIRQEAIALEIKLKKEDEEQTVQRFVSELEAGGAAVAGLKETLHQLNNNNVQLLIVTHNFSRSGRFCPACELLFLDEAKCPSCQQPTREASDIVDEALGLAMIRNTPVRQITPPSKLDHYGKIGAFLRYKT